MSTTNRNWKFRHTSSFRTI